MITLILFFFLNNIPKITKNLNQRTTKNTYTNNYCSPLSMVNDFPKTWVGFSTILLLINNKHEKSSNVFNYLINKILQQEPKRKRERERAREMER